MVSGNEAGLAQPDPTFHLSAGGVLERSFRLWGTNLLALSLLGLVIYSPALAARGLIAVLGGDDPEIHTVLSSLLTLPRLILSVILEGAVTYSVFGQLRGSPPSLAAALGTGLSRGNAVLGAGLLAGLAMLPACMCLIVPGLILATWFWVVIPVVLNESPGARASLVRSKELTKGSRWPIFACMCFLGVIRVASFLVIVAGIRAAGGPAVIETVTRLGRTSTQLSAGAQAVVDLLTIPLITLGAVGPAVAYHDLRVGKEGTWEKPRPRPSNPQRV
jgi:hypothetical protein